MKLFAGCPALKTPVQAVFCQARVGYAAPDHVSYEVTSSSGEVGAYDVTVDVKAAKPPAPSVDNPI